MIISDKVAKAIQEQVGREQAASNIYFNASLWAVNQGYQNIAKWFEKASQEEIEHRNRMLSFLADMGCPCQFGAAKNVEGQPETPLEAFQKALDLEVTVTGFVNKIASLIMSEQDWTSWSFWRFFLDEQLESVRDLGSIVARANCCNGNWLEFDESLKEE